MDRRVGLALGVGAVALGVAGVVGLVAWWAVDAWRGGDVGTLAERVPADASVVVAVRGLVQLAPVLAALDAHPDEPLGPLRTSSKAALGLDLTSLDDWSSSGMDPTRPWGLATFGRPSSGTARTVAWLPVRDADAALAQVDRVLGKQGLSADRTEAAGRDAWRTGRTAWTFDDDWLVVAQAGQGESPPAALEAVLAPGPRLEADPEWAAVGRLLPDPWQALVFVEPSLLDETAGKDARVAALQDFGTRGAGAAFHLGLERSTVRLAVANGPDADWTDLYVPGADVLADAIDGEPFLVVRAGVALADSMARARQTDAAGWAKELAVWRDRLGVDAESLLGLLDGQLTLAILESDGRPDMLAYAPVSDADAASESVKRLAQSIAFGVGFEEEETPDGQRWWYAKPGGIGVARDHLVFAGAPGHRERVRDAIAAGGPGYAQHLPDDMAAALRDGPPMVVWWDVSRTLAFLEASPVFAQWVPAPQRQMLSRFDALGATMAIDEGDALVTVTVWPKW